MRDIVGDIVGEDAFREDQPYRAGVLAGVCELADAGNAHLMDRADQALYRAKR